MKKFLFILLLIPTVAFPQVTYDTSFIAPSGGDYTSLQSWETAKQSDLTSGDGTKMVAMIRGSWSSNDVTCNIDGWTTSLAFDIVVDVDTSSAAWHGGVFDTSGTAYWIRTTISDALAMSESFVTIRGLQITVPGGSSSLACVDMNGPSSPYNIVTENCILVKGGDNFGQELFEDGNTANAGAYRFINNIIDGPRGDAASGLRMRGPACSVFVYNNTFIRGNKSFNNTASTLPFVRVQNNLFVDCDTNFHFLFSPTVLQGNYNVTDLGFWGNNYSAGANDDLSNTFTFVDSANDDYHLASGDVGAQGLGDDLSSDTYYPFDYDIDGDTRTGSWDCGMDQVAGAAPPAAVNNRRRNYLNRQR